jgi:hypothetical protein
MANGGYTGESTEKACRANKTFLSLSVRILLPTPICRNESGKVHSLASQTQIPFMVGTQKAISIILISNNWAGTVILYGARQFCD